jgi:integrase
MRDVMKPRGQTSVDQEFKSITLEELDRLLDVALNGVDSPAEDAQEDIVDGQTSVAADRRTSNRRIEDYLLVAFMGLAGLRVSEVCGIDVSDIHEDTVTVLGKGRKRRTVPLAPEIQSALEQYQPPEGNRHLFGSIRDPKRRLAPASVEQRIPRLATWAGIFEPRVTPHVLRHTFGSLMLAADPTALIPTRDLMGHESVETTNKYAHTRDADRRLALSSMNEMRNRRRP